MYPYFLMVSFNLTFFFLSFCILKLKKYCLWHFYSYYIIQISNFFILFVSLLGLSKFLFVILVYCCIVLQHKLQIWSQMELMIPLSNSKDFVLAISLIVFCFCWIYFLNQFCVYDIGEISHCCLPWISHLYIHKNSTLTDHSCHISINLKVKLLPHSFFITMT